MDRFGQKFWGLLTLGQVIQYTKFLLIWSTESCETQLLKRKVTNPHKAIPKPVHHTRTPFPSVPFVRRTLLFFLSCTHSTPRLAPPRAGTTSSFFKHHPRDESWVRERVLAGWWFATVSVQCMYTHGYIFLPVPLSSWGILISMFYHLEYSLFVKST